MFRRLYHSPVFNTWLRIGVQTLSAVIVLPFVLNKLMAEEINIWFLFFTITNISQAVLFGFNTTFARFIAYSYSGIPIDEFQKIHLQNERNKSETNWDEVNTLFATMKKIFLILGLFYSFVLIILGTWALSRPMSMLPVIWEGWASWCVLILVSSLRVIFGYYEIYLQGVNEVAALQRVGSITSLGAVFSNLLVMIFFPSLFYLVISSQFFILINIVAWIYFSTIVKKNTLKNLKKKKINKMVLAVVWESAWRSGITKLIAPIVYQISGIIVAQIGSTLEIGSYLLTQRIFEILQNFSASTLNARLPRIAGLRGQGNFSVFIPYVQQTMLIAYGVFLFGYIALIGIAPNLLSLIDSNIELGNPPLLVLFSIAYMLNRLGGFQSNMCNMANIVKEHIAIIIYSFGFFSFIGIFYPFLKMLVFPAAMITGQLFTLFYMLPRSYILFNTQFWNFERKVFIPFFNILIFTNFCFLFISYL